MKKIIATVLMAGLIVVGIGTQKQLPQLSQVEAKQDWVLLGERTVGDNLDHDTIPLTIAKVDFRGLQFRVKDN